MGLMGKDVDLRHIGGKKGEMILNKNPKLLDRIDIIRQPLVQTLEHAPEAVILDQEEQFFFRLAVMIKPREADPGGARDVAHRGRVIVLLRKDLRRSAQYKLQLLIVAREIF